MNEKIKKQEKEQKKEKPMVNDKRIGCPLCGDKENLMVSGRCVTCICGWSRCSL